MIAKALCSQRAFAILLIHKDIGGGATGKDLWIRSHHLHRHKSSWIYLEDLKLSKIILIINYLQRIINKQQLCILKIIHAEKRSPVCEN